MGKFSLEFKNAKTTMPQSSGKDMDVIQHFGRRSPIRTEPHWKAQERKKSWMPTSFLKLLK